MKAGGEPVVGFCFSFPMAQTALDKGVLLDWTKGFTCDGAGVCACAWWLAALVGVTLQHGVTGTVPAA